MRRPRCKPLGLRQILAQSPTAGCCESRPAGSRVHCQVVVHVPGEFFCYLPAVSTKQKIAVIPGDGIGKEVIPQAVRVIEATGAPVEWSHFDWGADRYLRDGTTVPPEGFKILARDFDAILVGAFGNFRIPLHVGTHDIAIPIINAAS